MTYLLLHQGLAATLLTDDDIVPAKDVPALRQSLDVLEEAERRLGAAEEQAAAVGERAQAEGLAEGLRRGEEKAAAEVARRLFDLEVESVRHRAVQRDEAAKLAVEIVRRIAGDLGAEAMIAALAEKAASELAPDTPAIVRVAPGARERVSTRLERFGQLTVVGDPMLDELDCVVETSAGVIRAGLNTQLEAIERAWTGSPADA